MVDEHIRRSQDFRQSNRSPGLSFSKLARLWRLLRLHRLLNAGRDQQTTRQHQHELPSSRLKSSLDEETPIGVDFSKLEYAVERKILEAPILVLSYYADVVGDVPDQMSQAASSSDPYDIGNGDLAPEWGIDLIIWSGVLRYGPWADRKRSVHRVFLVELRPEQKCKSRIAKSLLSAIFPEFLA